MYVHTPFPRSPITTTNSLVPPEKHKLDMLCTANPGRKKERKKTSRREGGRHENVEREKTNKTFFFLWI